MLCQDHRLSAAGSATCGATLRHRFYPSTHTLQFPVPICTRLLLLCSSSAATTSISSSSQFHARHVAPHPTTSVENEEENIAPVVPRKQNEKSAAVLRLLHHSDEDEPNRESDTENFSGSDEEEKRRLAERARLQEELALVRRSRPPRFPGAVDFPRPGTTEADLVAEDPQALRRALELRRGVAAEVLKVTMQASRMSINYSNYLTPLLSQFVDRVVIEAAAMRSDPELAHLSFNARARNFINQSGIVPLIKWLKHNSMSYPQIGKLICLCPGDLGQLRIAIQWLKSVHVKGEDLGRVLVKAGPIWERGVEQLDEIVGYLEEKGVRRVWMGFVIARCPRVLTLSMEELEERVKFYMDMGMNENDFGTMLFAYPRVLAGFSLEEMNCKVNYLKEFGLSTADVGRLLAFRPQLMGCSIEERWKPLVKYLYYLGIRRDGMRRMLTMKPMIFCFDLETTVAPKVRFLQDIGVREEAIGNTLVKFPALLTYSLYKKIRPVVIFLMTKAGVKQSDIGKVIALEPELLGCSIVHKLEISVKYFLSLGIRPNSLGNMIADFPMLLKYNVDVLRPKYKYLRRVMVRPLEDLIEFPRFFSYSLEGRIMPRHKILVENRVNFKLRYMLGISDEEFDRRVKEAVEKRRLFEEGIVEGDTQASLNSARTLGK